VSKRNKATSELPLQIKNLLRGTRDLYGQISLLRPALSRRHLPGLAKWLFTYRMLARGFDLGRRPRSLKRLRNETRAMGPIAAIGEVEWAASWLTLESNFLSDFVRRRESFDKTLLILDYDSCLAYLEAIENDFGFSQWTIENRLGLLQCGKGLEAQKMFLADVRNQVQDAAFEFVAYFLSQRNEKTTNPISFRKYLMENVPNWTENTELSNYFLFKLLHHWNGDPDVAAQVLRFEFASPTIDFYETFLALAAQSVTSGSELAPTFVRALTTIDRLLDDVRIRKLLFLGTSDVSYLTRIPVQDVETLDDWMEGDFASANRRIGEDGCGGDAESLLAGSWSAAESNSATPARRSRTLAGRIFDLAKTVVGKKVRSEEAYLELLRLAENFPSSAFSAFISLFSHGQMRSHVLAPRRLGLVAFVNGPTLNPGTLRFLDEEQKRNLSGLLLRTLTASTTLSAEQLRADIVTPDAASKRLSKSMFDLVVVEAAFVRHDLEFVITSAIAAAESCTLPFQRMFWRMAIVALLDVDKTREAVQMMAGKYLDDRSILRMLPLKYCATKLGDEIRTAMAADLSLTIVLDLICRNVEDHLTELRYAYEDFLVAHGLKRPSQLRAVADSFSRSQLVYYLRYVCVPTVMQLSTEFSSSRELEDERVAVCSFLKDLDDENASAYDAEIREITRKQSIHRGLREVERSKIWIDQEGLRRWANKTLAESFVRLLALRAAGLSTANPSTEDLSHDFKIDASSKQDVPPLPTDEAASLLVKMVSQFVVQCFLDRQNGLDCYLSLRVRHGALSGQMRAPLEQEKIVTLQKEPGSNEYASNEYWIRRLSLIDEEMAIAVDDRLRVFSRDFDRLFEEFAKQYLQIQSDEKKSGLFKSGFLPARVILAERDIHSGTSFDGFLDLCFQIFWESVDVSLQAVRNHINEVLEPKLNDLFLRLLNDIDRLTDRYPTPDLDNAIRNARTQAGYALDQIKDWFRQPKPLPPAIFTFRQLIEISLQAVTKMYRDFTPDVSYDLGELPSFVQLQRFTDIFTILFDNIWRHSGIRTNPTIHIKARQSDGYLYIEVGNSVGNGVCSREAEERLQDIRLKIGQGIHDRAARSEGGTGLMKISNIIGTGPEDSQMVEFGFVKSDWFSVRLKMPSTVTTVENITNETTDSRG
jgi:hypothetical protein